MFKNHFGAASFLILSLAVWTSLSDIIRAEDTSAINIDEPIAFVGHGAMFDKAGKEILLTTEFIDEVERFYAEKLIQQANKTQKKEYEKKQRRIFSEQRSDKRIDYYIRFALLHWLMDEVSPSNADRVSAKLNVLRKTIFDQNSQLKLGNDQPFLAPDTVRNLLVKEGLVKKGNRPRQALSTTLGGAA